MGDYDASWPRVTLRYSGLFDFDGLYATIIDWAKNYGYRWHEIDYKHKVPSPKGAEQEFKWLLELKVDEFMSYEYFFTVHIWDLLDVEVETNGKKKILSNGRVYIWIDTKMKWDRQNRFEKGGRFAKWLGKLYNRILEREITGYADQVYYRLMNLHAVIKTYFDMQAKKHAYKPYLGDS